METKIAVVTACHTRVGYNVSCALIRAGWKVVAAGRVSPSMCNHIEGIIDDIAYPDPFEHSIEYVTMLANSANKHKATVVLPVHEDIFVVSRYKEALHTQAQVLVPALAELLAVHDKATVPMYAHSAGVPTPRTQVIGKRSDIQAAIDHVGLPCIVKPRFGSGAQRIRTFWNERDLETLRQMSDLEIERYPCLLQQWVPGLGIGVNMLMKNGEILAVTGHRRLREVPITGGPGSAHITLTDQRIINAGMRQAQCTPFRTGVIMVEFRYDAATDNFFVVEVNPRYWASITNSLASGVNFPALHIEALVYGRSPLTPKVVTNIVESRFVMGEIKVAHELWSAGRWREIGAMFRRHAKSPLVLEDFGMGGIKAFMKQVRHALRSAKDYGNFGFQSDHKDRFFTKCYADLSALN